MITILFQTESHFPCNRKKIKAALATVLGGKVKRSVEVSVSIIGDRRMRQLNKQYRNIDDTTDVLSFGLSESAEKSEPFVEAPDNILRLGDIVISYPQAIREATEENTMVDDKIVELALHGLNHLLGIHHD